MVDLDLLRRLAREAIAHSRMGRAERVEYVSGIAYGPPPGSAERLEDSAAMPTSVTILQIHGHFTQELPRLLRRHAPEGEVWERNAICLSIDEQTGCAFPRRNGSFRRT
ncbi:MAG: hypothetical protein ACR2F6_17400 [Mycobacteriales bacterium]